MPHLDVVVPAFRGQVGPLTSIADLAIPEPWTKTVIIILDDPETEPEEGVLELGSRSDCIVVRNERNLGANGARNVGLDASTGEWILFLDDDIEPDADLLVAYAERLTGLPASVDGLVGVTRFPPPFNSFTRGVVASQMLTFFDLAEQREEMTWGVTANLLLRASSVGEERFDLRFPKAGGGEDIDFCLRILERTGGTLLTAPSALVVHPWWSRGRRQYRRFARWAFGDSALPSLHPRHRWRNLPNAAEFLVATLPLAVLAASFQHLEWMSLIGLVLGVIIGEVAGEWMRIRSQGLGSSLVAAVESFLIRSANDVGRVAANLSRGRIIGLTERFDYVTTGEWIPGERRLALLKTSLHLACASVLVTAVEGGLPWN